MNMHATYDCSDTGFAAKFSDVIFAGGSDGVTFIPYVSPDGIISWTNNGELPNPEPVNIKGKNGIDGRSGADGYTPVKGTDYWTEADRAEMVTDVISALPVYNGEVV